MKYALYKNVLFKELVLAMLGKKNSNLGNSIYHRRKHIAFLHSDNLWFYWTFQSLAWTKEILIWCNCIVLPNMDFIFELALCRCKLWERISSLSKYARLCLHVKLETMCERHIFTSVFFVLYILSSILKSSRKAF